MHLATPAHSQIEGGAALMNSAMSNIVCLHLKRSVFFLAIVTYLFPAELRSQVLPEAGALLEFTASEQQRFSVLTYSQSYLDDQHEKVSYRGTLYIGIHSFKLNECGVVAHVAVQDRFSGAIAHKSGLGRVHYEQTGELTDDIAYEYRFSLDKLDADEITAFRARPAQFLGGTNFQCEEDSSCDLSWLRLISQDGEISETKAVNGIQDTDTKVSSIALPMASPDSAANAAKLFSNAVRACAARR
jgi:hypothetical protein